MALYKRYHTTFKDLNNVEYRVEIWQDRASAWVVEEMKLAATPLTIEWQETEKLEAIKSSSATLNIWS